MALTNFTLPFGVGLPINNNWSAPTLSPIQQPHQATAVNNLLYGPESDDSPYYKNIPYAPPAQPAVSYQQQRQHQYHQRQNHFYQYRSRNNYLPPPLPPKLATPTSLPAAAPPPPPPPNSQAIEFQSQTISNYEENVQTYQQQSQNAYPINDNFSDTQINTSNNENTDDINSQSIAIEQSKTTDAAAIVENDHDHSLQSSPLPDNQPTFIRVNAGHGSKTQMHAVLDYDNDEQFDEEQITDQNDSAVTPIQGPIFIKNGSIPVIPLFSHPTLNNGTFVQIPIWWTALSVALGLEIRGEVIKGTPCVKRYNQLYCPSAGNSYPIDRIEEFIDENKALMRRMYGDFQTSNFNRPPEPSQQPEPQSQQESLKRKRRAPGVPDITAPYGDSYFGKWRNKRQSNSNSNSNSDRINLSPPNEPKSNRLDVCETRIEIVTPYWASNSAGKIRAIVNTQHFEQAIHQELCTKSKTGRCSMDCGCEQKYKWHRLLAYDPDDNCKGIFMDWFLFPSCCVCRCDPN